MATTQRDTVVGVFESRADADRAVSALQQAGFTKDQIGVVARDAQGNVTDSNKEDGGNYAGEGAVAGAVAGAGIGGLVGLGVIAGVIPIIGPAIAAGTLGTILLNAAGGAAIAGVAGALIGMGIPEEEAEYYEGELKSGRYLVTVKDARRYNDAWRILHGSGAWNQQNPRTTTGATTGGRTGATAGMTGTATGTATGAAAGTMGAGTTTGHHAHGAGQTVQVREEELRAHKQPVQAGEVRVHKEVVTEHKTMDVPVQREEVVVERHAATGQRATGEIRQGEDIRIPIKEEQVRVEKVPVVKEEVTVGKRTVQDTERVAADVRKEEVRVEEQGDAKVRRNDPNTPRKS